jgi:hypothetical protein
MGTIDHDQLTQIPGGKGQHKASKESVSEVFGFTGKNDETEG